MHVSALSVQNNNVKVDYGNDLLFLVYTSSFLIVLLTQKQ